MNRKVRPVLWVCTGCMFSGKTEEMIRLLRREIIAGEKIQVFKPDIDDRYGISTVSTHNGQSLEAVAVSLPEDIIKLIKTITTVVGIDEAQFFPSSIIQTVDELLHMGLKVITAGLNQDFKGEPFGPMQELVCRADEIIHLHAICNVCGGEASRTQRIINGQPAKYSDPIILVGAQEVYEARCREHHIVPR